MNLQTSPVVSTPPVLSLVPCSHKPPKPLGNSSLRPLAGLKMAPKSCNNLSLTPNSMAKHLWFDSASSPGYIEHIRSVRNGFLRLVAPEILCWPQAILEAEGSLLKWEEGLKRFYEHYPELWALENFKTPKERRIYSNHFVLAHAKKARAEDQAEIKRAAAIARRKLVEQKNRGSSQRARGRKRARVDSDSSPSRPRPSSNPRGWSPSRSSPPAWSPKRPKVTQPDLPSKSFPIILKGTPSRDPPANFFSEVWDFEELLSWVLKKNPPSAGQHILLWTEITIRNEGHSQMLGYDIGAKCRRFISDQASWNATLMMAQLNHVAGVFPGLAIEVALAKDIPDHDEGDVIALAERLNHPESAEAPGPGGNEEGVHPPEPEPEDDDTRTEVMDVEEEIVQSEP